MSVQELFSQRYRARIESGELFADDLYLHDYRLLSGEAQERLWDDAERLRKHVSAEGALRNQVWRVVIGVNEQLKIKDILRRAQRRLGDAYLQSRIPFLNARPGLLTEVCEKDISWAFEADGQAPQEAPFSSSKWTLPTNLLVFDFVEIFFDLLPNDVQLDFSRELNTRLQRGASRWYFQLGRWRRDDWPRDRDGQFDLILYSLKKQAEAALERRENSGGVGDDGLPADFNPEQASEALETAARALWQADRLLTSDLLSDKVRHNAAVRAARSALDACLSSFGGVVRGPFVKAKPARDVRQGGLWGRRRTKSESNSSSVKPSQLRGVQEPAAAGLRIRRLGEALTYDLQHLPKDEREMLLERVNLAEFLMRLALFGLPSEKSDPEEADAEEVRRYSKLTATRDGAAGFGGRRYNHGTGTVHLYLEDKATARLAVDLMARLCQYATGAATTHPGDMEGSGGLPSFSRQHPRQRDHYNAQLRSRIVVTILAGVLGVSLVGLGIMLGERGVSLMSLLGLGG